MRLQYCRIDFIVEHDLFRHDAMGPGGEIIPGRDGVAEAFEEFARKEGFSFFPAAPSTKAA